MTSQGRTPNHASAQAGNTTRSIAGVRFDSTEIGNNMSEILAHGTAVTIATT